MGAMFSVMGQNLLPPIILSFALGLAAAMARSSLSARGAAAKALSIYALVAIGSMGGVGVAAHGLDVRLGLALVSGTGLRFLIPVVAFMVLRAMTRMSATGAAAVTGHYGSVSIATFVSTDAILTSRAIGDERYMAAVASAMEAPTIVTGGMVVVVCIVRPERVDSLLDAAIRVVERYIGVVSVTGCEVLRAQRF